MMKFGTFAILAVIAGVAQSMPTEGSGDGYVGSDDEDYTDAHEDYSYDGESHYSDDGEFNPNGTDYMGLEPVQSVNSSVSQQSSSSSSQNATGTIQIGGTAINPKDLLSQLSGVLSSLGDALYKIHPEFAEPLWQGAYYAEEVNSEIPDNFPEIVKENAETALDIADLLKDEVKVQVEKIPDMQSKIKGTFLGDNIASVLSYIPEPDYVDSALSEAIDYFTSPKWK